MKKILSLLLCAAMAVGMSGCSGKKPAPSESAKPAGSESAAGEAAGSESTENTAPAAEGGKLALWSHWADEDSKKGFVMDAVEAFKEKNPGWEVEVTWYQKDQLIQALTAAFQSGTGPDIFYLEPAITGAFPPFVDNGFMYDLTPYLADYISDGAKSFASKGDMIYLLPLEAYTPIMYYNKDIFETAGLETGEVFNLDGLKDAVSKVKEAGFKGLAAGTMDREWCGSILLSSVLLRTAGVEKWQGLPTGETAWNDPDIEKGIHYVEELAAMGAYPDGVASIKLGESHGIFFAGEYAMFPMKSFFGGRAFVPVDKGGMAEDFPLGLMDMPTVEGGSANKVSYLQIGGSYGVNAASENPEKAAELLQVMAQPEMANKWMTIVKGQTGLKGDAAQLEDPYLKDLNLLIDSLELIPGPLELGMDSAYRDVFFTTSTALVAGQISADDMIQKLEEARAALK